MTTLPLRSAGSGGPTVAGPFLRSPTPVWAALLGSVMTFIGLRTLVPVPQPVGQLITQGLLPVAVLLALLANPGAVVRLNGFLLLMSGMAVLALMVSIHNDFVVGSTYRALRFLGFVAVLWLLTPWWGRADLPLLRAHLLCLRVVIGSVLLGALLAPGAAFSYDGRLSGALWPIPPTQVAHYAAMLLGLSAVLWFCGLLPGRVALVTLVGGLGALLGTHTRTALMAMVLGLVVAGGSLYVGHVRVRRTALTVGVVATVLGVLFTPLVLAWASRGQTAEEATQLTGRTKVWTAIFQLDRTWLGEWFGSGLSNKSFGGLAIDSNWVSTYYELGWTGVAVDAAFLAGLALLALTRPRGPRRALALFIVGYCLVASFTETGLGDASPYLLELTVAATLLATPGRSGTG